ncbi:MAG: hypothetical protein JW963_22990 [Anaerolineales bacterium]|nr:hypothetical protein [Anaerolineales bacterium]
MKNIGLCTHLSQTDEWAFNFALELVRRQGWQLTICHWLNSPYSLRRDMVYPSLRADGEPQPITPKLLTQLELELRQYYEPKLGDFTNVAFKLCEGMYQVELARCFHQNLLDLVVMGYHQQDGQNASDEQPLEKFAAHLNHPLVIVGPETPDTFLLNQAAQNWLDELQLPDGSWQAVRTVIPAHG